MAHPTRKRLSARTQTYVFAVLASGAVVLGLSGYELYSLPQKPYGEWLVLAAFTFVSSWLSVKLPSVSASISISEAFVFAGTLLYGPAFGTFLVLLDAIILCLKHGLLRRRLLWQQILFNMGEAPLSIWVAARLAGISHPTSAFHLDLGLVLLLGTFAALYFLLNSWLVAFVVALEQNVSPVKVWWNSFTELSVNFAAGASIAAFLVVNTEGGGVDLTFVGVMMPLLLVIYFTYRWSTKRIEAEAEKVHELSRVFLSTVEALALAIDAKDQVTHGHIRRVQRYTMALADALGIRDARELDAIRAAALLHDTGKLAVPEYILNKPGPLTASEFERMKVHADVGADILRSIDFPYPVEPIVRHHHEQWDGSGYPGGLRGQDIPLGARILSVVDCYDALTSDRPYRPRMTRQQAEGELKDKRGLAYDPWIVDEFLTILDSLEEMDAQEEREALLGSRDSVRLAPAQLQVIAATTAESREFNELRRDLSRADSFASAAEALFKHIRRIIPAATLALYLPKTETNELVVAACSGVGSVALEGLQVRIGDRISGWVYANSQAVINSDASLELGPVTKNLPVPLHYAAGVPLLDGAVVGVLLVCGSEPFEKDHRRLLENAATLFVSSVAIPMSTSRPSLLLSTAPADKLARVH